MKVAFEKNLEKTAQSFLDRIIESPKHSSWLVVEPTHLRNMLVKLNSISLRLGVTTNSI